MDNTAAQSAAAPVAGFFERHAWKVLLGIALIFTLFGLMDLTGGAANLATGETVLMHTQTGQSWAELSAASPAAAHLVDNLVRSSGAGLMMFAALSAAILLTAYRRHERWAWLVLWALPAWMLLVAVVVWSGIRYPEYGPPVPVISGSLLGVVSALCLLAGARPFFRRAV